MLIYSTLIEVRPRLGTAASPSPCATSTNRRLNYEFHELNKNYLQLT